MSDALRALIARVESAAPPAPMPAYVWQPTALGDTPSHNTTFTVWTYRRRNNDE
jgi:hypothetical protein